MFRIIAASLAAALAIGTAASPLDAQKKEKEPKRPKLDAGADTNNPYAYHQFGLARLQKHQPHPASEAFYWAHRLAPYWADPLYARRIALHLTDNRRLVGYIAGRKHIVESKEVQRIDSLEYLALLRDPFLFQGLDRLLLDQFVYVLSDGEMVSANFASADAGFNAWRAYANGQFARAAELYAAAIRKRADDYGYRAPRARALFHLTQFDSAASELTELLAEMRKREDKKLVYLYQSKAMFEYSLGLVYLRLQDYDGAREAFGRSLLEDMSFYMAHARLGALALALGDTAAALSELDLAVQLNGSDGALRFIYGDVLQAARRHEEAEVQFRRAIELEPYYAAPYFFLARVLEAQGRPSDALAQYRAFLARAAVSEPSRRAATERVTALEGRAAGEGEP